MLLHMAADLQASASLTSCRGGNSDDRVVLDGFIMSILIIFAFLALLVCFFYSVSIPNI